jgi:hypothetical protein
MVGQQMIMESRVRTRYGQKSPAPHPRTRSKRSRLPATSLLHSILKPLIDISDRLRERFRLPA